MNGNRKDKYERFRFVIEKNLVVLTCVKVVFFFVFNLKREEANIVPFNIEIKRNNCPFGRFTFHLVTIRIFR